MIGLARYFTGRAEETESHVLEALRLSPRDTYAYGWMTDRRLRKARSRPRPGSRRLAAPVYRCQSKLSHRAFLSRRRPGAPRQDE